MPDGEILVVSVCEEHSRRVADDADGVREWTFAIRIYPAPDASVMVVSGIPMHQAEFLSTNLQIYQVREAAEKSQDLMAFLMCSAIEQLPVGWHSAIHPPKILGSKLTAWSEGAQTHLLMIAEKHGHIRRIHDDSEEIYAQGSTVDHIP